MKEFREVIKFKTIPTEFVFRCSLCDYETKNYDRHFGLIKMNEHILSSHSTEVRSLDKEDLYSRRPAIVLDSF